MEILSKLKSLFEKKEDKKERVERWEKETEVSVKKKKKGKKKKSKPVNYNF